MHAHTLDLLAKAEPSQVEMLEQINQVFFEGKGIPEMSEG
jgi:hypothetical protein